MEKKIMDIMTRGVVTARVDNSVFQVAQTMIENNVSVVVVVDENSGACGLISKTDVLKYWGKDINNSRAEDIMSPKIHSLPANASLSEAAAILTVKKIHQLVIMKGDPLESRKPIGILTIPDLMKEMIGWESSADITGIYKKLVLGPQVNQQKLTQEVFNLNKNYWSMTMEIMAAFNEKVWSTLLEQGAVGQQEGKKMLSDWLDRTKQAQDQFAETMEKNWKKAEAVFGNTPKSGK